MERNIGIVARVRVNPKDCMAVVDLLRASNIDMANMSFSSAVSLAFTSLLEGARTIGVIPTRSGFEYLTVMKDFELPQRTKAKLDVAHTVNVYKNSGDVPSAFGRVIQPTQEAAPTPQVTSAENTQELRDRIANLHELRDSVQLTEGQLEEYKKGMKIIYPEMQYGVDY